MDVLSELENIHSFPVCRTRKNVSVEKVNAFCLGDVNYRGQRLLNYQTRGPSRFNKRFSVLFDKLKTFINDFDSEFEYTTIQINKNIQCEPHVDKNNVGLSYIIAIGDYEGGDLIIEGKEHLIKNKWLKFNGRQAHWTNPFIGTRYSIIYFTHTFKPPSNLLIKLKVSKDNVKDKNRNIISSW